jgi:hypothetical protein
VKAEHPGDDARLGYIPEERQHKGSRSLVFALAASVESELQGRATYECSQAALQHVKRFLSRGQCVARYSAAIPAALKR